MQLDDYLDRYQKSLSNGAVECEMVHNYLVGSRGLTDTTIGELGLGYCPREADVPGDTPEQRKENSILKGRVILPIREEFGGVVALAARHPSPSAKGWWNQRFDKGNHIFLFDKSRRHAYDGDKIYLVEGYFDAIVLWQYGIRNVGCLMGTSLGMRRIGLIARYCENVCLMFDTDPPREGKEGSGQRAQRKAIGELSLSGLRNLTKIDLPVGMDPDEYVVKHGPAALLELEFQVTASEQASARKEYLADRNRK